MRKIIDLSVTLEDVPTSPAAHRPTIEYTRHDSSPDNVRRISGLPPEAFLDGQAWASERVTLSTHSGTHMDAPWHYHPTMNHALKPGGEPSSTIDQMPLELCFQPGVKLDFRHLPAGHVISAREIEQELDRIGHKLQPLEIVLVNTRAAALYGTDEYWQSNCGIGREGTLWLLDQGIRVVGTDAWGWDVPFSFAREIYEKTGDRSVIWEGHKAGKEIGYYQMEKLCNLDLLPPSGFMVCCFPVKIKGASAGWVRAVGIMDDEVPA